MITYTILGFRFECSPEAIIGGAFTVMSMTSGMLNVASKQFKVGLPTKPYNTA